MTTIHRNSTVHASAGTLFSGLHHQWEALNGLSLDTRRSPCRASRSTCAHRRSCSQKMVSMTPRSERENYSTDEPRSLGGSFSFAYNPNETKVFWKQLRPPNGTATKDTPTLWGSAVNRGSSREKSGACPSARTDAASNCNEQFGRQASDGNTTTTHEKGSPCGSWSLTDQTEGYTSPDDTVNAEEISQWPSTRTSGGQLQKYPETLKTASVTPEPMITLPIPGPMSFGDSPQGTLSSSSTYRPLNSEAQQQQVQHDSHAYPQQPSDGSTLRHPYNVPGAQQLNRVHYTENERRAIATPSKTLPVSSLMNDGRPRSSARAYGSLFQQSSQFPTASHLNAGSFFLSKDKEENLKLCPCSTHQRKMQRFLAWYAERESTREQRRNQSRMTAHKPLPEFREAFPSLKKPEDPFSKCERVQRVHKECTENWIPYTDRHFRRSGPPQLRRAVGTVIQGAQSKKRPKAVLAKRTRSPVRSYYPSEKSSDGLGPDYKPSFTSNVDSAAPVGEAQMTSQEQFTSSLLPSISDTSIPATAASFRGGETSGEGTGITTFSNVNGASSSGTSLYPVAAATVVPEQLVPLQETVQPGVSRMPSLPHAFPASYQPSITHYGNPTGYPGLSRFASLPAYAEIASSHPCNGVPRTNFPSQPTYWPSAYSMPPLDDPTQRYGDHYLPYAQYPTPIASVTPFPRDYPYSVLQTGGDVYGPFAAIPTASYYPSPVTNGGVGRYELSSQPGEYVPLTQQHVAPQKKTDSIVTRDVKKSTGLREDATRETRRVKLEKVPEKDRGHETQVAFSQEAVKQSGIRGGRARAGGERKKAPEVRVTATGETPGVGRSIVGSRRQASPVAERVKAPSMKPPGPTADGDLPKTVSERPAGVKTPPPLDRIRRPTPGLHKRESLELGLIKGKRPVTPQKEGSISDIVARARAKGYGKPVAEKLETPEESAPEETVPLSSRQQEDAQEAGPLADVVAEHQRTPRTARDHPSMAAADPRSQLSEDQKNFLPPPAELWGAVDRGADTRAIPMGSHLSETQWEPQREKDWQARAVSVPPTVPLSYHVHLNPNYSGPHLVCEAQPVASTRRADVPVVHVTDEITDRNNIIAPVPQFGSEDIQGVDRTFLPFETGVRDVTLWDQQEPSYFTQLVAEGAAETVTQRRPSSSTHSCLWSSSSMTSSETSLTSSETTVESKTESTDEQDESSSVGIQPPMLMPLSCAKAPVFTYIRRRTLSPIRTGGHRY